MREDAVSAASRAGALGPAAWHIDTPTSQECAAMLRWAFLFLIVALIAGALGMFRVEAVSSELAWILFVVFIILFVVSLVVGRSGGPPAI
jgi:uncharacterized membrane protein YtjA (UPF0391 family)